MAVKKSDFKDIKEFMAYVRNQKKNKATKTTKKGKGFLKDIVKNVASEVVNRGVDLLPLPQMIKNPVRSVANEGANMLIEKGLGMKRKTKLKIKGGALLLPK